MTDTTDQFAARKEETMTLDDLARLRVLLTRGLFFPEARELALLMLTIAERRKRNP